MSTFYRMLYESTSGHVKLFIPMTLRNLKFIIDYFIKTKPAIWSMVHSTLRKMTAIHKIKADSLMIMEEKAENHGLWATKDWIACTLISD